MTHTEPTLGEFITITEVDYGPVFVEPIFQRNYRLSAPHTPHHIVAFYKNVESFFIPVSYLHFNPFGDIMLIGGACTDGRVIRSMDEGQRGGIFSAGGLMLQTTRFALSKFGKCCDAVFGHCGDARSFEVLMQAGFQPAGPQYILVYWTRLIDATRRRALIAKAQAIGPF